MRQGNFLHVKWNKSYVTCLNHTLVHFRRVRDACDANQAMGFPLSIHWQPQTNVPLILHLTVEQAFYKMSMHPQNSILYFIPICFNAKPYSLGHAPKQALYDVRVHILQFFYDTSLKFLEILAACSIHLLPHNCPHIFNRAKVRTVWGPLSSNSTVMPGCFSLQAASCVAAGFLWVGSLSCCSFQKAFPLLVKILVPSGKSDRRCQIQQRSQLGKDIIIKSVLKKSWLNLTCFGMSGSC